MRKEDVCVDNDRNAVSRRKLSNVYQCQFREKRSFSAFLPSVYREQILDSCQKLLLTCLFLALV